MKSQADISAHEPQSGGSGAASAPARGLRGEPNTESHFRAVIDAAVNFRGDATLTLQSRDEPLTGYIFDFAHPHDPERAVVRLLPASGEGKRSIRLADIASIELTGRDTAEGKSFETWVRKYVERKLAGKSASIESEPLED